MRTCEITEAPLPNIPGVFVKSPVCVRLDEITRECQRLRLEFLLNTLRFNLTVVCYTEPNSVNQKLRENCWTAARSGYNEIRVMLRQPAYSNLNIEAIPAEFDELGHVLEEAAEPPAPPILAFPAKPKSISKSDAAVDELTPRETEVLRKIAEGHSTKEVAHLLGISFKTAACHRYRIMDKLGIHDAVNLTRYAVRSGLVLP